jgi:hypothetical protein
MVTRLVAARLFLLVAAGAGPWQALPATAANYSFVNIVDTSGPLRPFEHPSINASGTVAFLARHQVDGTAIFTGKGGPLLKIVSPTPNGVFFQIMINDNGTVVFTERISGRNDGGIYTSGGGPRTTIADTAGPFDGFVGPAINNHGTVAFKAGRDNGASGIFSGSGGPTTTIADTAGPYNHFADGTSISDNGTIAFTAGLDAGGLGIFIKDAGPIVTIVDTVGPFSGFAFPSVNSSGDVAFHANLDAGGTGIFIGGQGRLTRTVVDSSGPFSAFDIAPSLNAEGMVVFSATLDAGGHGIFTGPDPLADGVIRSGDALLGSTATSIRLPSATRPLNDNGEIVFEYALANGINGIAVARLIPEPSSAILLAAGLLGVWRTRCRRHSWKHT